MAVRAIDLIPLVVLVAVALVAWWMEPDPLPYVPLHGPALGWGWGAGPP